MSTESTLAQPPLNPGTHQTPTDSLGRTNFLAHAIGQGDRAPFPELFERVMPALYTWTELRLRRSSPRRIEVHDVLQEVWLRALEGFHAYDSSRSFRAWILGIAKNVLLQQFEKLSAAPLPLGVAPMSGSGMPQIPDSVTSIDTRMAKDDSMRRFLEFIDELDEEERSLLIYCGIEGYSSPQAAERLGISPEATNKRWQALRARLRQNSALEALASAVLE